MQITLFADRAILEAALAQAAKVGVELPLVGLHAPVDATFSGYLEEAWEVVKANLQSASDAAGDKVKELRQTALDCIDKVLAEAGHKAADIAIALRERLRQYVATLINGMLSTLRPAIELPGTVLKLAELDISQKVVVGGSLKAALTEAIALTSSGEFTVQAKYRIA